MHNKALIDTIIKYKVKRNDSNTPRYYSPRKTKLPPGFKLQKDIVSPLPDSPTRKTSIPDLSKNILIDDVALYPCIIKSSKYERSKTKVILFDNNKYSIFKLTYTIIGNRDIEIILRHRYKENNCFISIFFSTEGYICEWKGENIYSFYNENNDYYTSYPEELPNKIDGILPIESGVEYKIIFKSKTKTIELKDKNNKTTILFENVKLPLYPCVSLDNHSSIELLSLNEKIC